MYHPEVIQRRIESAIQAGLLTAPPAYRTREEINRIVKEINSSREIDDAGNVRELRPLTPEEIEWIRTERILCRCDFHYFATRYCYITTSDGQVVPFSPWISQKIFLDVVGEMEKDGLAIMIQQLKARQLGISRLISLMVLHRALFYPHTNAIIASSTPAKTIKLLDMLEFPLDRLPWWMVPRITARRRDGEGGFLEFGNMDSGITLQHGAQMTGIARGTTPTVAHLTELAEFDRPESIVDASLLRAMHDSPRTMLILEGTGEGQFNWWHRKWLSAKEGWPERRSRLRPIFLPWFVGTDLYPTPAWLRAHPIPKNYQPKPYILHHARRAQEYVRSDEILRRHLGEDWSMPAEQMWFYEVEHDQAARENRLNLFLQEMPASDDEAFQSSNISVFDVPTISAHKANVRTPVGVYGLVGPSDEVPPRLQPHPSQIDSARPPIEILADWGQNPVRYLLVPLKWSGYSTDSGLDKIYLWEHPQPGEVYGLGVDTSYGVQKDRTCIQILRKGTPWSVAAQVGEFCSDKVNALDATPFCMALATYFSVPDSEYSTYRRQCRVAIECRSNGDQTQLQMRMRGWSNFHPWTRIDSRNPDPSRFNKIGVFTNEWFRAGMMEFMIKMLRDMELEVRSPWLIQEMQTLEADWDRQSIRAAYGGHDDRFMSLGFIVISLYQWERNRPVSSQTASRRPDSDVRRYAGYRPGLQDRLPVLEETDL